MKKWFQIWGVIIAVALLSSLCGCGSKSVRPTSDIAKEITSAESASVMPDISAAPMKGMSAQSAGFQTPCIEAPYDYEHWADDKQLLIRRFQYNDVTFFIADVQLTDPAQFRTALSEDKPFGTLETASEMAQRCGAVLAINADDYGVHKYGTIIRNGELIRANDTTRNMLIVDANGNFSVRVDRTNEDPEELGQSLIGKNTWQTFEFGPELIRNGEAVEFSSAFDVISTKAGRREPRTAIGQIGPLHYVIIVADGRQSGYSKGMTLDELQQLFIRCGAQTAMNLDGGGSTEMWFDGAVINQPSEGKERRLSDILFF